MREWCRCPAYSTVAGIGHRRTGRFSPGARRSRPRCARPRDRRRTGSAVSASRAWQRAEVGGPGAAARRRSTAPGATSSAKVPSTSGRSVEARTTSTGSLHDARLLLDAAGVRDQERALAREPEELPVAERLDDLHRAERVRSRMRPGRAAVRGCSGSSTGSGSAPSSAEDGAQHARRRRRSRAGGTSTARSASGSSPKLVEQRRRAARRRAACARRVDDGVPGDDDPARRRCPSAASWSRLVSVGAQQRSARWSVTTRLCSSGIARS